MPLVLFPCLLLLTEVVCGFLVTEKSPSPQAMKIKRTSELKIILIASHAVLRGEMLDSGLEGTWHLRHPVAAKSKLCFKGVKIPSFGGRIKPNPGIRSIKVALKGWWWGEPPKQNNPKTPNRQRTSEKKSYYRNNNNMLLCAREPRAALRARLRAAE